jgi:uncharacterized protein (UPF0335 family)
MGKLMMSDSKRVSTAAKNERAEIRSQFKAMIAELTARGFDEKTIAVCVADFADEYVLTLYRSRLRREAAPALDMH